MALPDKVKNAKQHSKIYFGLHMAEGVAHYIKPGKEDETIFIGESTLKGMDASFKGRPLCVGHVDSAEPTDLDAIAVGYVVKSFYNPPDGKHWVQFIATEDAAHDAIRKGWVLSNCYTPTQFGPGGEWHGVAYGREVRGAEYDHMALVDDPRYAESIILTEEEFVAYNKNKEAEAQRFANSKGEKKMPNLKFWKREKIENSKELDLETVSVQLPLSKKEFTIAELVDAHDKVMNMNGYANGDHMVKCGEDEMTVNQLSKKYNAAMSELADMKKANEADDSEDEDMENGEDDEDREKEIEKRKNSKADDAEDADEDEESEDVEKSSMAKAKEAKAEKLANAASKKAKGKENFERVSNAAARASANETVAKVELQSDKVQRGRDLFGSN